ncbi:hypothetical protein L484_017122 [Morus notabilis]|uniref:Uncharacterized protein n=1 Tax=Morus notabilis TaxID=981085 RepID=W9S1Q4_9ROSA|nr:hypothetical protein L484_017122 [Morus notabilis]
MPETTRYTALVEGNHKKAADMAKVLEDDLPFEESPNHTRNISNSCGFFSKEFVKRHGLHLLGPTSTWFLLDIAFYSLQLTQKDIYPASGLLHKASTMNAIEDVFELSKAMFLIALAATVPAYWFIVLFIGKIGRFIIQLGGFLFMAILGFKLEEKNAQRTITTFIVPAELFPVRFRSTCHGISAAAGKAGAITGAFVVQSYTSDEAEGIRKAIMGL